MHSITDSIAIAIDGNLNVVACNKLLTKHANLNEKEVVNQSLDNFFKGKSPLEKVVTNKNNGKNVDLVLNSDKSTIFRFNISPVLLDPTTTGYMLIGNIIRSRKDWDETLFQILKGTYNEVGGDFFKSITKSLAKTLNMRYAFIGELHNKNSDNPLVKTITFWDKSKFKDNITYNLIGSPCENVIDHKQLIVLDKVADLYPKDHGLAKMGVKSYVGTPIYYKDGSPMGLVVVMDTEPIHISEEDAYKLHFFANRIGTEMEWFKNDILLKEQEEKLRTIIQSLPDPVYCQNNNGVYETCNDAYLNFFSISEKDVLNKPINELPDKITTNRILSATEKLEKVHGTNRIETSLNTGGNRTKNAIVIRSPIIDENGQQTGIVGVIQDISEMKEAEKSLKINEEKYRTLFNKANDAFLLMSNDIFVDCNPKALEMFGCSRDKLVGKPPYLFSPAKQPDKRDSKVKALEKINAAISGKPQSFYWKHKRYNGDLFDAEVSLNAFYIKNELFIQAIVRDVSEKVKATQDIEEQTKRMEKMYAYTSDTSTPFREQVSKILEMATQSLGMQIGSLSEVDGDDYIFNDFYSNISDFSTDDIHYLSQTYCSITVEENKLVAIPRFKTSEYAKSKAYELLQLESYIGVPYWVRGKLRGTLSFSSFYPVKEFKTSDADFVQIIAQWIGSTLEREEYEESLRKNQALLDTLLREIPVDFSVRDASLKMLWQSNTSKTVWGNYEGKPIDFSDTDEKSGVRWREIFRRVLNGEVIRGEDYVKIYGKPHQFYSVASPIMVDGKVEQVIVINVDISQLKKAEKQLKSQNEKLKKLNAELDRFVYSASHDLRAPLASLLGLIDLSKREPLNPALKEYLSLMNTSITKLDGFISDITDYSRNLRLKTSHVKVDFESLVKDIYNSLMFMSSDKIKLTVNVTGRYNFYSDIDRLKLILSNLISNSIRYRKTRGKPYIKVEVKKEKDKAIIQIIDNGIGIEEKYQKKVFEMFFRANDQNTGSGLGLFIVQETTDKLKGKIKLKSKPNKGSNFTLEIPNSKP